MSEELQEGTALMVLNGLPKVGPVSLKRLLDRFDNDALAILRANRNQLIRAEGIGTVTANTICNWRKHFNLEREEKLLQEHGVSFTTFQDREYPALLQQIYDPPIGLYWRGRYQLNDPCIAVVGTRRPTLYGRGVARRLAADLVRFGFCVVSGMARGIDSEAHEGALQAKGKTVAVIGCGLDIIYPPENLELYRRISQTGAVISEFPFGRRADRQTFPMRNRIIAGLCLAVVVVESDIHGGSMITARFTAEYGRQAFAVPGRIDQAASRGCHQLIRDGAILLSSVDDLVEELRYLGQFKQEIRPYTDGLKDATSLSVHLSNKEKTVLQCFEGGGIYHPDRIAALTDLPLQEVTSSLMMLELKHLLAKRADGSYESRWE